MALEHEYPLPPADLFGVVTDLAYLEARHARFGGVGSPEVADDGELVVVRIARQLPLDKIPSAARAFVGDGVVVQEDTWQRPDAGAATVSASWQAKVDSAPARLGGEHRIEPSDAGSRYAISVEVSVSIPLLGRRIEEQISGYLQTLIGKELDYLADWVEQQR